MSRFEVFHNQIEYEILRVKRRIQKLEKLDNDLISEKFSFRHQYDKTP